MDKLKMAHEYLRDIIKASGGNINVVEMPEAAWKLADAMQAEADERAKKCDKKIEINMYPEWDASINYPPDAWVMYRVEKRLAVSIKEEWQPDWSQAPEWVVAWTYDKNAALWWSEVPEIHKNIWDGRVQECANAPSFNYQGNWQDSLRKRPTNI